MKYDDEGNLILSGKLGEAVISGEGVEEYAKALFSGKSESLSYQDMQDFQDFTSEFFAIGIHRGREDYELWRVILRKADQAPFGVRLDPDFNPVDGTDFIPMQPFTIQGYEPAE